MSNPVKLIDRPSYGLVETRIGTFDMLKPTQKELKAYYSMTTDEDVSKVVVDLLNTRGMGAVYTAESVDELTADELQDLLLLFINGYRTIVDVKEAVAYAIKELDALSGDIKKLVIDEGNTSMN